MSSAPFGAAHPRRRLASGLATGLLLVLAACGAPATTPAAAPATTTAAGAHPALPECPAPPQLSSPPRRVVTMDGGAAAILVRLGLRDRIVGTAAPDFFGAFTGTERAELDAIPVLDPGQGNAEAVIAAKPDLVVGSSTYSFGGFAGTPTVQQLTAAGAQALVACKSAAASPIRDLSVTTTFIEQVATAFQVEAAGKRLTSEIQSTADRARSTAPGQPVRVLALSGAPTAGKPIMTQGGASLSNGIITLAGGENIAQDVAKDFASLSAEEVVTRDPQAIVVVTGFAKTSDADLVAAILSSPALAPTTAVREKRVVVVPQSILLSPSVLGGDAVATIAAGLRKPAG